MSRILVFLALLLASPPIAFADDDDHDRARAALQRGEILPLSRILDIVRRDTPGRVIDVELDDDDGRHVYEMEILDTRGRVVEIKVDAASGRILKREIDD